VEQPTYAGSYSLNGKAVTSTTIAGVYFFDTANNGMFSLLFSDGEMLNLYGPQVFTSAGQLIAQEVLLPDGNLQDNLYQSGSGSVNIVDPPGGPPISSAEPTSIALVGVGVVSLAGYAWRWRKRPIQDR
jgi:hypothetical protein